MLKEVQCQGAAPVSSYVLRIKPVSSRSKIDVLREFGHRCFVEVGDDGKPIGYFVETKETAGITATTPRPGRRTPVTGNVALVWAGKPYQGKKPNSIVAKVAETAKEFATIPTRRAELVEQIVRDSGFTEVQVTNSISALTTSGHLVVPG